MSAVPSSSLIESCLERIHERFRGHDSGAVADYIPELSVVDPDRFGIVLATADGTTYAAGDVDVPFTIQSISKPFTYGLALEDHGVDAVLERIGVEPSGDAFNSIVMDERRNRPMNPMVNAGAIAAAALVRGDDGDARLARVLDTFGAYAGRSLEIDDKVFRSERATGHRNRAIAFLELSSGMITEPVDEHLDLYFRQCSILVTARDLAQMGATLANGGVHPGTGRRAIGGEHATRVLSVMATCGMYDWSGEWMYRVGLPAKSGVGGGILVVLPGQLAIATYSPRLDEYGNSARGVLACEAIAAELSLHLLHPTTGADAVVRRHYHAADVSSKRVRRDDERSELASRGKAIEVFELQGNLTFATTERMLREVEPAADRAAEVVLDVRRVGRLDPTSAALLGGLVRGAAAREVRLVLASAAPEMVEELTKVGWPADGFAADADEALERAEDRLLGLAALAGSAPPSAALPLAAMDILAALSSEDIEALAAAVEQRQYAPGERIIRAGDAADRLQFLASGRAAVMLPLETDDRSRRLRTLSEGVSFGESALFDGARRSADVVAESAVTCYELTVARLEALASGNPRLHAAVLDGVGRNLVAQLARAMGEIRSLDA